MTQSPAKNRIVVGQFSGVYGVKGWLKVKSHTEPEENILNYTPWYIRSPHGLKQVIVDEFKHRPQGMIVHIQGIDDRDVAAQIGRSVIEVDKDLLPELEDGEFYWHQLEGLRVVCCWDGEHDLGHVYRVMETGANDVLVVKSSQSSIDDRERLIPLVMEQYVTDIDLEKGELKVIWDPEF